MKSLEEVIEAEEICSQMDAECSRCPYKATAKGWCEEKDRDALHYLKVLKDISDPLKVKKNSHEITCPQCNSVIAILLPESNEPLTWDELKAMEGKPVWVEADDGKYKGWVVVEKFYSLFENEDLDAHVNLYYFGCSMEYSKEMYRYYWQAYRKERE